MGPVRWRIAFLAPSISANGPRNLSTSLSMLSALRPKASSFLARSICSSVISVVRSFATSALNSASLSVWPRPSASCSWERSWLTLSRTFENSPEEADMAASSSRAPETSVTNLVMPFTLSSRSPTCCEARSMVLLAFSCDDANSCDCRARLANWVGRSSNASARARSSSSCVLMSLMVAWVSWRGLPSSLSCRDAVSIRVTNSRMEVMSRCVCASNSLSSSGRSSNSGPRKSDPNRAAITPHPDGFAAKRGYNIALSGGKSHSQKPHADDYTLDEQD